MHPLVQLFFSLRLLRRQLDQSDNHQRGVEPLQGNTPVHNHTVVRDACRLFRPVSANYPGGHLSIRYSTRRERRRSAFCGVVPEAGPPLPPPSSSPWMSENSSGWGYVCGRGVATLDSRLVTRQACVRNILEVTKSASRTTPYHEEANRSEQSPAQRLH
eukprot:1177346-Prorocentrum_minimum.AAC.6